MRINPAKQIQGQLQYHTGAGKIRIVGFHHIRMNQQVGRNLFFNLMVIGNDDLHAKFMRFGNGFLAFDAIVDRKDEVIALLMH